MLRAILFTLFFCVTLGARPQLPAARRAFSQEKAIDWIVARVEDDILFESELVELGRLQQLQGSAKEGDAKLLDRLIDQWIVNTEAASAHFSRPTEPEIEQEIAGIKNQFGSTENFEKRMQELRLTAAQLHRLVSQQLFLTRYIDYKFRTAVQIPQADIDKYYRETLAPKLAGRGQALPAMQQVGEEIRRVLVEREINLRANGWLEETRGHLRIERNTNPK